LDAIDKLKPHRGRTAIVTGSGQNIGRAIALGLARAGANVVVNGHRNSEALEAVAAEIRGLGAEAMTAQVDVGDPLAVQGMVDRTVDRFGGLDIAVSNVAVRRRQAFLDISVDDWNAILNTNLSASFYLARACLPHMMKKHWGRVVHISGCDGFVPEPNRAHNVTCKAGVFALAKAIALEFGPHGITANTIAPGVIDTPRDPVHYPDHRRAHEARRQMMPARRLGRVEEIAEACLYLCSENAGFVSGQVVHVNGGEFMF
jgi:3-oxoacyl-[acyl-carrier protein] reductase